MKDTITLILIIIGAIILVVFLKRKFKSLSIPSVMMISGRIKSGKTGLCVHLAIKQYKKELIRYYIGCCVAVLFHREKPMKPMLYSNIPLAKVKHNPFTFDILLQKVRIPNKSIVLIDEASLLADSMLFNDKYINNKLMRFVKLFAHYSHCGHLFINSQSMSDLHHAFKRSIGSITWIEDSRRFPFFTIMRVREMIYADDKSIINTVDEDAELTLRTVILLNKNFKKYDKCCYSIFTDDLPMQVDYDAEPLSYKDNLKVFKLVSLQDFAIEINRYLKDHYPKEYDAYGYIGLYEKKKEGKKDEEK